MEYVPGGNLSQYSAEAELLPVARVIEVGFKCCAVRFRNGWGHVPKM